jgi:hypothetical protein
MTSTGRARYFDIRPEFAIAAANHFLDFSLWARPIVDQHSLSRMQHPHVGFLLKHCLRRADADERDSKNRDPKD